MGEIEKSLFPGVTDADLTTRLNNYINEGYLKAGEVPSKDAAAKAWAYHRAYFAVYLRMSSEPTRSELVDQAVAAFDPAQAMRFLELARKKEDEFFVLIDVKAPSSKIANTSSVKTQFNW